MFIGRALDIQSDVAIAIKRDRADHRRHIVDVITGRNRTGRGPQGKIIVDETVIRESSGRRRGGILIITDRIRRGCGNRRTDRIPRPGTAGRGSRVSRADKITQGAVSITIGYRGLDAETSSRIFVIVHGGDTGKDRRMIDPERRSISRTWSSLGNRRTLGNTGAIAIIASEAVPIIIFRIQMSSVDSARSDGAG